MLFIATTKRRRDSTDKVQGNTGERRIPDMSSCTAKKHHAYQNTSYGMGNEPY